MKTKIKQRASALMMILFTATLLGCPLGHDHPPLGHNHQIDEETKNHHVATPDSCFAVDCGADFVCIVEDYENTDTGTFDTRIACVIDD